MRAKKSWSKSCALQTRIGRRLRHISDSGPYDVCLSTTQVRSLFAGKNPGKPIGCGTFACVWPGRTADQVVKLTRDREDAEGLKAAQGMGHVVKVFDIHELPRSGRDRRTLRALPVYAITAERLQPLTSAQQVALAKPLERARTAMLARAHKHKASPVSFLGPNADEAQYLARRVCARTPGKGCERFAMSFFDVWSEMFRRGIVWQDAHTGNVAIDSKGRWKAIDLGFSGTKRRTKLPVLNGARARR